MAIILMAAIAFAQWVSWYPPGALIVQANPMNTTHFMAYLGSKAVYIAQEGLTFMGSKAEQNAALQYLYSLCKFVAVDVHNATAVGYALVWTGDVYCGNGTMWMPLKWLSLRFTAYVSNVKFVNVTNATVVTPIGAFYYTIPAGWYYDPATRTVFNIPQNNVTAIQKLDALYAQAQKLQQQLQIAGQNNTELAILAAQLSAKLADAQKQVADLQNALNEKDSQIKALQAELNAATAENERLRAQIRDLQARLANQSRLVQQLQLQLQQQQQQQLPLPQEGGFNMTYLLIAALVGVVGALIYIRKKRAEE